MRSNLGTLGSVRTVGRRNVMQITVPHPSAAFRSAHLTRNSQHYFHFVLPTLHLSARFFYDSDKSA